MELCQNKALSGYGKKIDHLHLKSSINLQQCEYNGMAFLFECPSNICSLERQK